MATVLSWYKGNTKRILVNVKDANTGFRIDLTGGSVAFAFANKQSGEVAFTKTSVADGGITMNQYDFTVQVDPADTANLPKGDYIAQAKITLAGGDTATVLDVIVSLKEGIL